MLREAAREVRLLGAQAVGVVLVLGRDALQALRAPVVDAPAKAHFAHTDASRAKETAVRSPAFAHTIRRRRGRLQRPRPRRERLPRSCLRLNVDPWRSPGCPKRQALWQIESRRLVRVIR